jgi:hypothetical protein
VFCNSVQDCLKFRKANEVTFLFSRTSILLRKRDYLFSKILVPLDGFEHSFKALDVIVKICEEV